jgi:hypothetical protein
VKGLCCGCRGVGEDGNSRWLRIASTPAAGADQKVDVLVSTPVYQGSMLGNHLCIIQTFKSHTHTIDASEKALYQYSGQNTQ